MPLTRFDVSALPPMPWKNGGGTTREVASWPPGAGIDAFDWRVSIATIASDGPFSSFAGVDRIITLLEGDGVRLQSKADGIDHALNMPLAPFAFSGDSKIDCTLLGGASTDFNVMSRRSRLVAEMQVLSESSQLPSQLPSCPQGMLLAFAGSWSANTQTLSQGQGLWWVDEPHEWRVMSSSSSSSPDAKLIAVRWLDI